MYKVKEESAKQLCAYFEIFPEYMQILKINRYICESSDDRAEKLCKTVSSRLNEEQKNLNSKKENKENEKRNSAAKLRPFHF